ncbi:hypothetical protein CL621_03845 [archaeon]|nr:hypothetical protein [archaeon]
MKETIFKALKKRFPKKAKEFLVDLETLALFLNSPVRDRWMKFSKLNSSEIRKINKIVNHYAELKVKEENKKKPKTRKQIIKIENLCLIKIFLGKFIKIKENDKTKALKIIKKLLKIKYPESAILDTFELSKLSVLTGANEKTRNFSTDLLVFYPNKNKIIGIAVLLKNGIRS